jgi:hypothetical protein
MRSAYQTIAFWSVCFIFLLGLPIGSTPASFQTAPSSALGIEHYESRVISQAGWGTDIRSFGLIKYPEGERVGPRTFCVDRSGSFYIFDMLKGHIKHFGANGCYLGKIGVNVPGYSLAAGDGELLVLDGESVFTLSLKGKLTNRIPVSPDIGLLEGYGQWMTLDEFGRLYARRSGKSYQIGKYVHGCLNPLPFPEQLQSARSGFPNSMGDRWCTIGAAGKQKGSVKITNDENLSLKVITMATPDSFGMKPFLDQDEKRHLYIQTQRITDEDATHLEVRKYAEDGKLVAAVEFPNTYYTTVYKKLEVDMHGNIFQLMTTPEGVKIIKWEPKGE